MVGISRLEDKGIFWRRYHDSLVAFGRTIESKRPDYIVAMTRKAPRLLELCDLWGIDYGQVRVLTEKALELASDSELRGKGLVIVDDIIILGSTIHRLVKRYPYLEKAAVICLVCDEAWFTKELVQNAESQMLLNQHDSSVFCHELVQSIGYLNKPYDLDHPILYGNLSHEYFTSLCSRDSPDTPYEISSSFHRSIQKRRFSFLPNEPAVYDLITTLLNDLNAISPQICKNRLYYDEETFCANLVPMVVYDVKTLDLRNGKIRFAKTFDSYNQLVERVLPTKSRVQDIARFRVFGYLFSYLSGLSFCVRNSNGNPSIVRSSRPSSFLKERDLNYLFGQRASQQILEGLDHSYEITLAKLKEEKSRSFQLSLHVPTKVDVRPEAVFNSSETRLLKRITPYLRRNIRSSNFLEDQLACIFEGLFYNVEIPARKRISKKKSVRNEPLRLAHGFTYEQIRHILGMFGVLDIGDPFAETRLTLAIDRLVDCGVIVPFYIQDDTSLKRFYRYGEDSLCQRKLGFLLAGVLRELFTQEQEITNKKTIPKIPFEKILVLLTRKLGYSPQDVNFLQPDPGMSKSIDLRLGFCVHGAVLEAEYLDEKGLSKMEWASDWCVTQGIIDEAEKDGFSYSNSFLSEHMEDLSMVSETISSKYLILAEVLRHLDLVVDKSGKHEYLVCLSTCNNARNTMAAMARELYYLFETTDRESQNFSKRIGYSLEWLLKNPLSQDLVGYLKKSRRNIAGLLTLCETRVTNAGQTGNEILSKYRLYNNRLQIIGDIKSHFQRVDADRKYRVYYQNQLLELLDEISEDAHRIQQPGIDESLRKLAEVGNLCVNICAILKVMLEVTSSLTSGYITKEQRLHKATVDKIGRGLSELARLVQTLNQKIKGSQTTFPGRVISELPEISSPVIDNEVVPGITVWGGVCQRFLADLTSLWSTIKYIYAENYAPQPLKKEMDILFPSETLVSSFKWVIWYDIKDSQGRRNPANIEKTPRLKEKINWDLKKATKSIRDGKFTSDKNDEKFIHTMKGESVPTLLQAVLDAADDVGMFLRIGIAGVDDTGIPFLKVSGTDYLESESTFALPKRLATCLNSDESVKSLQAYDPQAKAIQKENDTSHTIVISNETFRQVWDRSLPLQDPTRVSYTVDGKKEYTFHILQSIPRGSKFLP